MTAGPPALHGLGARSGRVDDLFAIVRQLSDNRYPGGPDMSVIAMRDLSRKTRQVVEEVRRTGKPAIVTQYGRPTVAVINVPGDGELEDLVLAHAPRFLRAMQEAEADAAE